MFRNYFQQIYYLSANEIIVDYLACCLIEVLIDIGENPIKITIKNLAKIMRCKDCELEHSLKLLKSKELINYSYSINSIELLAGTIIITLNQTKISKMINNDYYKEPIKNNSLGGFVYLLWKENSSEYKIGKAKDVKKRIKQLSTANSENLILVKSIFSFDYSDLEKSLHRKYRHYRIKREWFSFSENVLQDLLLTLERYK